MQEGMPLFFEKSRKLKAERYISPLFFKPLANSDSVRRPRKISKGRQRWRALLVALACFSISPEA